MTRKDDAEFEFDQIGYWSEVKLDILRDYAAAYSSIAGAFRDVSPSWRLCTRPGADGYSNT